jgi:hypothetical protein
LGSFRKLQIDDALMLLAVATDAVLHVTINIQYDKNSNLIDPDNPPTLTSQDIAERTFGSKLVLVIEQMQILTIWLVKTCLLLMYSRFSSVAFVVLARALLTDFTDSPGFRN